MSYSNNYLGLLNKKTIKGQIQLNELRKLFFSFLDCPNELKWDISNFYFSEIESDSMVNLTQAEKLSELIDLFSGEYEEDRIRISNEELKYISEGVNDFALEMTDDTILNVMKLVVSRGII